MKPKEKYLHFKPSYQTPLVAGLTYFDISNADLCRWSLENFQLTDCFPKVSEAYYLKLRLLAPDLLLVVENDFMKVFDLRQGIFVHKLQLEDFIQEIETEPSLGIVVASIASATEDSKEIIKWKVVDRKLEYVGRVVVSFNEEIYDSLFMLKVFPSGRTFFYRRGTDKIFEVCIQDAQIKSHTVPSTTTALLELSNKKDFAVASLGKIDINDPTKGVSSGYIDCKDEVYNAVIQLGQEDVLITASNKAVKMWPMKESKGEPKVFAKSDRLVVDRLSIHGKVLVGMADKNKAIAVWDIETCELIRMEKISRQQLQRSVMLNTRNVCLVIKVFDQTEETMSYHHKLEIYDVNHDTVVTSKEIKKAGFNISVQTLLRVDDQTIRFVCYSDNVEKPKQYLFTWKPFVKEQKKDMTKIDIVKAPITKLYAFDRILFANPPKQKIAVYNAFGKSQHKTRIAVNTHGMKKLIDISFEGYCDNFELAPNDRLYAIKEDNIQIFGLQGGKCNKILDVKLAVTSLHSIGKNLLAINSSGDRILYDSQFQLLMKSQQQTNQQISQILPLNDSRFLILYKNQILELWDEPKQQIRSKKLDLQVIDLATTQDRLFVTQSNRIEVFDVYSVLG